MLPPYNDKEPASPSSSGKQALRLIRLAHLLGTIFSCTTSTNISFLHLGQNSGNLISTVLTYTLVLVLAPQTGQWIQKDSVVVFGINIPPIRVRLCVQRLAHLLTTIFSFTTSMQVSFLHLGQNSGNLISTVSAYTFVRVLLRQIGQGIHRESFA